MRHELEANMAALGLEREKSRCKFIELPNVAGNEK